MNTKLTLSLDSAVIKDAKRNLQTKDKSLSSIIEDYFKALLTTETNKLTDTPIVDELSGVASLPKNKSSRQVITEYLLEKHR